LLFNKFFNKIFSINIEENAMTKRKRTGKSSANPDLALQAYQGIRQMLFFNEIIPGQKIKYQDLADRLGVSITPVTHALKFLEFKGIVRHESNKGYYINEVSSQEVEEIYDTRILIEVSLVPDIMRNLKAKELQRLDKTLEEFNRAVDENDYYKRLMTDMKFHLTLASIAKHRLQLKMLQELFDLLLLKYSRNLLLLGIRDSSQQEHFHILKKVQNRSTEDLQKAISDHLQNVKEHISKGFDKMFVSKKESMVDLFSFQQSL
jgi:DNA-binding GntR family transcriptional regulator